MEDVELNILKEKLEDIVIEKEKTCTFYKGKLYNNSVILCATNIGSINATIAVLTGIHKYNPKVIIVQGVAGGHGENIHVNDIVIGTEIININSLETKKREKGEGSNSLEWKLNSFLDDENIEIIIEKSDNMLIENAKKIEYKHGKIFLGRIGSGDIWNKEIDRILMFNENYQTLCEEMEGYAISRVASIYNIPFIHIRAISNNEMLGKEYKRDAGKYAQEFTLEILRDINKF